jgi:hypothetical protein
MASLPEAYKSVNAHLNASFNDEKDIYNNIDVRPRDIHVTLFYFELAGQHWQLSYTYMPVRAIPNARGEVIIHEKAQSAICRQISVTIQLQT